MCTTFSFLCVMDDSWCACSSVFTSPSRALHVTALPCAAGWAVVCDANTEKRREIVKCVDILRVHVHLDWSLTALLAVKRLHDVMVRKTLVVDGQAEPRSGPECVVKVAPTQISPEAGRGAPQVVGEQHVDPGRSPRHFRSLFGANSSLWLALRRFLEGVHRFPDKVPPTHVISQGV